MFPAYPLTGTRGHPSKVELQLLLRRIALRRKAAEDRIIQLGFMPGYLAGLADNIASMQRPNL